MFYVKRDFKLQYKRFSDRQYIYNGKNPRIFLKPYLHEKTTCQQNSVDRLVQ